ncbi:hypothetical protein B0A52_04981 [Exophiala mesophila]|uniref:SRR1-like domain-containing protein n=1 Tax=Exophiala mesophila TaxID=212818 RepID=A0A438N6M7_EXOME|nr:hypothetical protein B0A52_04981 [Exophiala mesophila]
MPHTSHKKKNKKRHVTVDEDGWTKVITTTTSTGPRIPNISQPLPTASASQQLAFSWNIDGKHVSFDMTLPAAVAAPSDMTVDHLDKRFRAVEARWLDSESWAGLDEVLRQTTTKDQQTLLHISRCILIGSGSCSTAPSGRQEVTFYQVAAFKAAVDLIRRLQKAPPVVYAQEPLYNDLDAQFLHTLGISVVQHPRGFDAVDDGAVFMFSPCPERFVELQIMQHRPTLWLHRPLLNDRWPSLDSSPNLDWMLHGRNNHSTAISNSDSTRVSAGQDHQGNHRSSCESHLRAEYLVNRALFEHSRRRYKVWKLPSLPAHNLPFEGAALLRYDDNGESCDDP